MRPILAAVMLALAACGGHSENPTPPPPPGGGGGGGSGSNYPSGHILASCAWVCAYGALSGGWDSSCASGQYTYLMCGGTTTQCPPFGACQTCYQVVEVCK